MPLPAKLNETSHRPWPLPGQPWVMHMCWRDLLFLHWPVPPRILRPLLPPGLELDTYGGDAWLSVVPFRMTGVRPRFSPDLPGLSAFPELNLRTYAKAEGKAGVWFFSLDVPKRLPVWTARTLFRLPYNLADMSFAETDARISYASRRRKDALGFTGTYRPKGGTVDVAPGSLEEWLTERYCLYSADRSGRIFRGDVHHLPWPLEPVDFEIERCDLPAALGLSSLAGEPLAQFSRELDVVAWNVRPLDGTY